MRCHDLNEALMGGELEGAANKAAKKDADQGPASFSMN
jgi:hypothetical protein